LRVLSYNVLFDGLFGPARVPSFERILRAIEPNLIGFQEIYNHNAQETANQVESMLPSSGGEQWYSSKVAPDIVAVSRYQITDTYAIDGNGAFLIDLRPAFNSNLLLIVAHPPCCANNEGRQREIDAMMAFIRDAKAPGGVLDLAPSTPILIVGDMNLVGFSQQLKTLLTGDIVNVNTYGPPFAPDWDGSDFVDLMPRHTDLPMTFTWFNPSSSFSPGRLDFIVYSESLLDIGNNYILFTPSMSEDSLVAYGLQASDATLASDHLPVVSDFVFPAVTALHSENERAVPKRFSLDQNYPNPFNPVTTIRYGLPHPSDVRLHVYDILGQHIMTLVDEQREPGNYQVVWGGRSEDGRRVGSGVYFYTLRASELGRGQVIEYVETRKLILLQ
ncbi:MAG: endonuclease/exonuclease/phosphatase family protein, partial [Bacteroidota bacterium]